MVTGIDHQQSDRRTLAVFRPEVILPVQLLAALRPQPIPEKRLMIAILADAIHCVRKYRFATGTERRRAFREAQQWFVDRTSKQLFSFERICDVLGLDADCVRRSLR